MLPPEDDTLGMCGKLNKSMYGTRDAAQNWEKAYNEFMSEIGFEFGISGPRAFLHKKIDLRVAVHGDDFTILGHEESLDWFTNRIQQRFEVKFRGRLGSGHRG